MPGPTRCAIYTRKSSDEGLGQAFNSLDAQREACEAYVRSQAGEGWIALAEHYDDGGFSGATMRRPGLERLLRDVDAGGIDLVIVYKVDRLTRALADFAKMIEIFDAHAVAFVSVTQAFNTTSSMSRLTLNVLLSFAQFEREITSERIRDKVAASKAKGMWLGGAVPLGYDAPRDSTRTLRVNENEAATVRSIFKRYLKTQSFHQLARQLDQDGIRSKSFVTAAGRAGGGFRFTHGALRYLLANRVYLGEIVHKGTVYPGRHEAIIDRSLFDAVQGASSRRASGHRNRITRAQQTLLNGLLFDADDQPMKPVTTSGRSGPRYQYYASLRPSGEKPRSTEAIRRVPCHAVDELVRRRIAQLLWGRSNSIWPDELRAVVSRVEIHPIAVHVVIRPSAIGMNATDAASVARVGLQVGESLDIDRVHGGLRIVLPVRLVTSGARQWLVGPDGLPAKAVKVANQALVRQLRGGHRILRECGIWPIDRTLPRYWLAPNGPDDVRRAITALLAPDIQRGILSGQVRDLDLGAMPLWWPDQRESAFNRQDR